MFMVFVNFLLGLLIFYMSYKYLKGLFDLSKCELCGLVSMVIQTYKKR